MGGDAETDLRRHTEGAHAHALALVKQGGLAASELLLASRSAVAEGLELVEGECVEASRGEPWRVPRIQPRHVRAQHGRHDRG